MFGANDDNQNNNDDPAMLDSVKDLASQPAAQVEPQQASTVSPTTMNTPGVGTPSPSVGFSMPSSMPAPASTDETAADDTTTPDNPGLAMAANPAHAEPAPGFSNAADFNVANQPAQPETSLTDSTFMQPPADTSVVETVMPVESPQIIGHPTPSMQSPATQLDTPTSMDEPIQNDVAPPPQLTPVDMTTDTADFSDDLIAGTPADEVDHEHMAAIKQEALGHLEALSEHLEGDPEVVFTTTMQMIQANDNHTLLQKALDAAKQIKDDKVRAQAMQDIINETNYFSPQDNSGDHPVS